MTICQSRISPFGKVRRGRCLSIYSSPPPENHGLKIKNRPAKRAFISIPLKAGEKDRSKAKKKAPAYKSVAQSGTIKPSCEWRRRWRGVGIFTFSRLRETTPEKKKKTHTRARTHHYHTWQSGFSVLPSIYEMSTKAEQCKYGCLVCGFPPVMSWGGGRVGG